MWVYLLIAAIVVYAIYKERQALGCPNMPDGTDCDNANGKPIKGTHPLPTEATNIVVEKTKAAADFASKWVMWRTALILAVISTLLIFYFLWQRFPTEKELAISGFVITGAVYFTLNFYKFHLFDHARNNIDDGIDILNSRIV